MDEPCVCGCLKTSHHTIRLADPITAHDPVRFPLPDFATYKNAIGYTPPGATYYVDECDCGKCYEYKPDLGAEE